MLKNKIILKKIRNIIFLGMIAIVVLGVYNNIRNSKAEDIIEFTLEVQDRQQLLEMQEIAVQAIDNEDDTYTIKLPKNVNEKNIFKYYLSDDTEISVDQNAEEDTAEFVIAKSDIIDGKIQIDADYDKKEVFLNEDGTIFGVKNNGKFENNEETENNGEDLENSEENIGDNVDAQNPDDTIEDDVTENNQNSTDIIGDENQNQDQDEIQQDGIQQDGIQQDGIQQDGIQRDDIQEDEIQKDGIQEENQDLIQSQNETDGTQNEIQKENQDEVQDENFDEADVEGLEKIVLYNKILTYEDKVTVEGYMPENAVLEVKEYSAVDNMSVPEKNIQNLYDISILKEKKESGISAFLNQVQRHGLDLVGIINDLNKDDEEYDPSMYGQTLKISIVVDEQQGNFSVYQIDNDDIYGELPSSLNGNILTFETDKINKYAIASQVQIPEEGDQSNQGNFEEGPGIQQGENVEQNPQQDGTTASGGASTMATSTQNSYNTLRSVAGETSYENSFFGTYSRRKIKSVTFKNNLTPETFPFGGTSRNIDEAGTGSIILWVGYKEKGDYFDAIIGFDGTKYTQIYANADSSNLFNGIAYDLTYKTASSIITGLQYLNTSKATNMSGMFSNFGYYGATSLGLGASFDTSSVTDMSYMFSNCGHWNLSSLNLGTNFNTSNVTNMSHMFEGCGSRDMTSLSFGNKISTSNVKNMSYMFASCSALTSLDLSAFSTSKVTDMMYMFFGCSSLNTLKLGDNFDTGAVTNMMYMFFNCGSKTMTSLSLGNKFKTTNVTRMDYMFDACGSAAMTSLDLGVAFTKIASSNTNFLNNCGKSSGCTIYVPESIFSGTGSSTTSNSVKLSSTSSSTISYTRGKISLKYYFFVSTSNNSSTTTSVSTTINFNPHSTSHSSGSLTNGNITAYSYDVGGSPSSISSSNISVSGSGTSYTLTISLNTTSIKRVDVSIGKTNIKDAYGNSNIPMLTTTIFTNSNPQTSDTLTTVATETGPDSYFFGTGIKRRNVYSVHFQNNLTAPSGNIYTTKNVDDLGSGSIKLWLVQKTGLSYGYWDAYIGSNGTIYANPDSSCLFAGIGGVEQNNNTDTKIIYNLNLLNTSKVTKMDYMFYYCGYDTMTSLDLGSFNTNGVTSMQHMFDHCGYKAMTSLNLGTSFNTSKVTDMQYMFGYCGYTKMSTLSLGSNFDTTSVTNMSYMFAYCAGTSSSFTSLSLGSKFNTSKVTDMSMMFDVCGYRND